jgi:hypothetical protein
MSGLLRTSAVIVILACTSVLAEVGIESYADARALWLKTRDTPQYQNYLRDFVAVNNELHLDERAGCYSLSQPPVDLLLVITATPDHKAGVIQEVLADVSNEKARCFQAVYLGVRVPLPPFQPFILQMHMAAASSGRLHALL